MESFHDQPALLAATIFLARVTDVSLGTLRTVLLFRGRRLPAAIIGFFEVIIWVAAARTVLADLDTWWLAVAFAGGFATGNYVGLWLEAKLAIGHKLVRIISDTGDTRLAQALRGGRFGVVEVAGRETGGRSVDVLLVVERRRRLPDLLACVEEADPAAVVTISDVAPHRSAVVTPTRGPGPRWFGVLKQK